MFGISVIYILNYILNDKYDIQYSLIKNTEINSIKMNEDKELNPNITMFIELYKFSNPFKEKLSDKFKIFNSPDEINFFPINRG